MHITVRKVCQSCQSPLIADPDLAGTVFIDASNLIALKYGLEIAAVKTVQTVGGRNPHKTVPVLDYVADIAV